MLSILTEKLEVRKIEAILRAILEGRSETNPKSEAAKPKTSSHCGQPPLSPSWERCSNVPECAQGDFDRFTPAELCGNVHRMQILRDSSGCAARKSIRRATGCFLPTPP
jgi:hypothetical protein